MPPQIIFSLVPVIALIIGFFLNQVAGYLQTSRDEKRILKEVLFNQLDVWFELLRADWDALIPLIKGKVRDYLAAHGATEEQLDAFLEVSNELLQQMLAKQQLTEWQALMLRYNASVQQLAKVEPLLAFRLSGRPQPQLREKLGTLMAELQPNPDETEENAKQFIKFIQAHGYSQLINRMEKDIVEIATKLGWRYRRHTQRLLDSYT